MNDIDLQLNKADVSNLQQIDYYTNCVPAGFNYNMASNLLRINYY